MLNVRDRPRKATSLGLLLVACALSLASLLPSDEEDGVRRHGSQGESWTVLVYMVADNNLEEAAVADLYEMMAVGSGDRFNLVVQADRAAGYTSAAVEGIGDWTSTRRLFMQPGWAEVVEDLGEVNMGDPAELEDFIRWGIQQFPADRYALIFWDHGASWPGFGGDESTPDHDLLDLSELAVGMHNGLADSDLQEFSFIGFDACLMATVEVALSLEPLGEYLLASEDLEPGHGWDYRSLQILRDDPTTDPLDLGRRLLDGYVEQARVEGTEHGVTLSLTDLYTLGELRRAIEELAEALRQQASQDPRLIAAAYQSSLRFADNPDPRYSLFMVDAGHLSFRLANLDASYVPRADAMVAGLRTAVVDSFAGGAVADATGLSIYLPLQRDGYQSGYDRLEDMAAWRAFLDELHGGHASGVVPRFTNPDQVADYTFDDQDNLLVWGSLAQGSASAIVDATLFVGVVEGQDIFLLGDRPSEFDLDVAAGLWDLTVLTLSQGSLGTAVYSSLIQVAADQALLIVPCLYQPATGAEGQYAELRALFDSTGRILQSAMYAYTEAGPGELMPLAGSALYPLLMQIDSQGNQQFVLATDQPFDPNGTLSLGSQRLGSGTTVFAAIIIQNAAGQGDLVQLALTL